MKYFQNNIHTSILDKKFFKLIYCDILSIMHRRIKRIHLVGIGGVGMCGIAEILIHEGYCVTGSDIVNNSITRRLIRLGVKIFFNHHCDNVNKVDVVVISSAIAIDNPEVIAAKKFYIPVIKRADMLAEIMRFRYGIVISGTHGKTTTTTMLSDIYIESNLDPTVINGGLMKSEGVYARFGYSNYLIAEVDESDNSFLCIHPMVTVITNIEPDHVNMYHGNFNYVKSAFIDFLHNLPFYGYAVMCIDDPVIREILPSINRKIITYGFHKDADFLIFDYYQHIEKNSFIILNRIDQKEIHIVLNISGVHNALNATAAIIVAIKEGVKEEIIVKTMLNFQGTSRRFENLGYCVLSHINGRAGKFLLIDDYGHHPSELCVTIKTIRVGWPHKRLVMVFQPHRFTRLQNFYDDFVHVLSTVDVLLVLNVYSAGEDPIVGIDSISLCDKIRSYGKINPLFIVNSKILFTELCKCLRDNDLLLIQGAGTIGRIIRQLVIN